MPVMVAFRVTNNVLFFYSSGIYTADLCNPGVLNHSMLAVGFGVSVDFVEFVILQNSWSTTWGE